MKPITHLLGNKVVAQRYLWFAERKLSELKMVMGLQNLEFGQRMYRLPNDSVEVFVQSYLGVDKIRIAAMAKECEIDFVADVVEGNAPLTVNFTVVQFCSFFKPTPLVSSNQVPSWLWNFGQGLLSDSTAYISNTVTRGAFDRVLIRDHSTVYKEPGQYSVSLEAYKGAAISLVMPSTVTSFTKSATGSSNAEAHSNFLAAPWVDAGTAPLYLAEETSPGTFQYSAGKFKATFDLTAIERSRMAYSRGIFAISSPVDKDESGFKVVQNYDVAPSTTTVIVERTVDAVEKPFQWSVIYDATAYLGTVVSFEISDISFPLLSPPNTIGDTTGWRLQYRTGGDHVIVHPKLTGPPDVHQTLTKTNYITVT